MFFFNSLAHPLLFRTEVEKGYPKVLNDSFYGTVALAFFHFGTEKGGRGQLKFFSGIPSLMTKTEDVVLVFLVLLIMTMTMTAKDEKMMMLMLAT